MRACHAITFFLMHLTQIAAGLSTELDGYRQGHRGENNWHDRTGVLKLLAVAVPADRRNVDRESDYGRNRRRAATRSPHVPTGQPTPGH